MVRHGFSNRHIKSALDAQFDEIALGHDANWTLGSIDEHQHLSPAGTEYGSDFAKRSLCTHGTFLMAGGLQGTQHKRNTSLSERFYVERDQASQWTKGTPVALQARLLEITGPWPTTVGIGIQAWECGNWPAPL
jgi:hypothetical protein